ncbi:hypothetical protein [Streptomyces agglomeratus]|uniref:hypothetical protein n=1 Tax=Streptomyces agglomeratus TaxID=285458 RepID=UPI00159F0E19|nr:hypothetical protein [Streptomyces agglomeratus]
MGNYGSLYDVVAVANAAPKCEAGELITGFHENGLIPTFMYRWRRVRREQRPFAGPQFCDQFRRW